LLQRFALAKVPTDASTVLAAVTTAWALNIPPELISAGLDTFVPELPAGTAKAGKAVNVAKA